MGGGDTPSPTPLPALTSEIVDALEYDVMIYAVFVGSITVSGSTLTNPVFAIMRPTNDAVKCYLPQNNLTNKVMVSDVYGNVSDSDVNASMDVLNTLYTQVDARISGVTIGFGSLAAKTMSEVSENLEYQLPA